jgi:CheY-like chemotaxis protein
MMRSHASRQIVLHADDDPDDIQLVREAFAIHTRNVEVMSLHDGLEALAWLKSLRETDQKPCLIILDINMPRMDGKETLQHIRTMGQFDQVPVMLFTTSAQRFDQDFAQRFNAGFLTKPIDDRQMETIVKNFLAHCSDAVRNEINRQG